MFRIGNVLGITKYFLLSALTLSSECLAAVNKVQSWGKDDQIYFFTTRRPYIWEWFTDSPTYKPSTVPDSFELEGRTIFFIVLFISITIISFIVYLCRRHWNDEQHYISQISGATVHPPPRNLDPSVLPGTTIHGYSSGNSRPLLAFANVGYQNDSTDGRRGVDVPPDYATVAIADLTTTSKYNFPVVVPPNMETPPPTYQVGYKFP